MAIHFSIIIPAKNEAANIGRCLDSIQQVRWDQKRYEVIVVDNGSSDNTVDIARAHGAHVFIQPLLTIAGLRNYGASHASGDLLVFLDADCTVVDSWLEKASIYLKRTDVACFGSPPIVPSSATWVQKAWFAVRKKTADVCMTDWLESMNMFVRREAFISSGGFDEALITCEDYDLSLRLKQKGLLISDSSIIAVHHGEAATVRHFFQKELWRGKSNFAGMRQHGLTLAEAPSLIAPSFHCLLWFCLIISSITGVSALTGILSGCLIFWQTLLVYTSAKKLFPDVTCMALAQLLFLMNIYLFARGIGVFSSGRRTGLLQCVA